MTIRFFAHARDAAGCETCERAVDGTISESELWDLIAAEFPEVVRLRGSLRIARNFEYAEPGTQFEDADEIALIPPVSGG